jgi:hypothetical protein
MVSDTMVQVMALHTRWAGALAAAISTESLEAILAGERREECEQKNPGGGKEREETSGG